MAITDKQVQAAKEAFNAYPELTIEELPNAWLAALAIAEAAIRKDCADIIKRKIDALEQEFGRSIRSSNLEEARAAILASIPENKDVRA